MRDDLTIGVSVKNIRLTKHGVDCVDTICQIFLSIGAMIFGRLFRKFQKNQNAEKHLDLTKINLGQKKIFIGMKQKNLVKITSNICGTGVKQSVQQIQNIILIKIYADIMVLILNGTKRNFWNKMVFVPFAKNLNL